MTKKHHSDELEDLLEEFEYTKNKYIFADIRYSASQSGKEEVDSPNVCSQKNKLKQFKVHAVDEGWSLKFCKGGDVEKARCRNKVRAWCKWVEEKGNTVHHWVMGTHLLMDEWERFDEAAKKLGRYMEDYIIVIEQGEKGKRLHIHMVVPEFIDQEAMRALWEHCMMVKDKHLHVNVTVGDLGASQYLSKYVSKENRMPGRRLFRQAKGLTKKYSKYLPEKKGDVWIAVE